MPEFVDCGVRIYNGKVARPRAEKREERLPFASRKPERKGYFQSILSQSILIERKNPIYMIYMLNTPNSINYKVDLEYTSRKKEMAASAPKG